MGAFLLLALPVPASTPQAGDDKETVVALLGRPDAAITSLEREVWFYERGKVVLEEDRVMETNLLTAEELEAERARRERAEARQAQQAHEAGVALKQAKLADPLFRGAPAEQQVAFWQDFKNRYPGVAVDAEYTLALQQALREQTEALRQVREAERIRELEERVRLAEARAAAPRDQADQTTVNVVVNAPAAPQPIVVVQEREPEPVYYGVVHHRPVGHGLVHNRAPRLARKDSRIHLGTRGVERTGPLGESRVGQASTVFRPPLPRPPLVPSAFSPL